MKKNIRRSIRDRKATSREGHVTGRARLQSCRKSADQFRLRLLRVPVFTPHPSIPQVSRAKKLDSLRSCQCRQAYAAANAERSSACCGTAEAVPVPGRESQKLRFRGFVAIACFLVPRRCGRRRRLISRPAVEQIHQCLVQTGSHGMALAGARDIADMYFYS